MRSTIHRLSCSPAVALVIVVAGVACAHLIRVHQSTLDDAVLLANMVAAANPIQSNPNIAETDPSWWEAVTADLSRAEYSASRTSNGLQAPNRAHNLRTTFEARGIDIVPRNCDGSGEGDAPAWRFAWRTSAVGRSSRMLDVAPATPEANGTRVTYHRDGWSEWYENTAKGLEQGFIIERKPEGEGPLRIAGDVSAGLEPRARADGAIDFVDAHGACAIRYAELHAWDARGVELPAELALEDAMLSIVIDDRDASYPLIIDPLMTSPAWTAEGDLNNAFLGFSVATAGDVNGDGYSDVIVGAWGYASEGRAFVYHGSASGLSPTPNWTADVDQTSAQLGYSVSTAGDVNGDGFDDVIIGANLFDNGSTDEGRAFVYHGSASGLAPTPNWTAESNQDVANFGMSVATAGDVNGDGFNDVIVGCPYYDNPQSSEGCAFVYHGSASGLSATPNWIREGGTAGIQFSSSVSTAGDVNADGFSDVIVGAWLYTAGQTNEGGAFVFHGSSSGLSANPNWDAEGDQALAYFGVSVAGAGDVNGDGFGDVIVGEQNRTNGQSSEGRAYVFFGSAEGLGDSLWIDESDLAGASFGHSVATAGDVNGDGYADVIVGAPSFANGQVTEGRVFVYQGSAFGPAIEPTWTAESNVIGAQFGISVATAGDVNGDGLSDVIAGAWTYANGNSGEGGAFVYHGAAAGLKTYAQWAAESDQVDALFGISVATAGDVNGDGFTDVIVGACGDDFPEVEVGRAYVYHGSASGLLTTAAWTVESDQDNARFGWSVSTAGDVNGDGFSDVIVGAPLYYNSQTFYSGRTYVYHGSASGLSTTAAWMVDGPAQLISFGAGVATAGDVNGDGFSDVVIGAPGYDNGEGDEGRAFVFHGSAAGLSTTAAWHAEPNTIAANFGCSVSTAGDVNGDGFSDVIVGAVGFSDLTEGQAFVYHGSTAGLLTTADWIAEASQLTGRFGSSVSTAGDVNGDGFSDVIVGAPEYDGGLQDEGRAFVYHGSALGLSTTAAWTGESDQTGATFGISAATAGDVNGDGFSDVIVGVDRYDNGQQDEGRALVYYGSESGLALAAAWAVESNHVFGYFGHSVTTAGDMNGDGFSDVIIGAHLYSNGQTHEGRAFAYYANDENGLDRIPRQARTDDSAPISLLGASNSESAFQLKVLGRTPAGRGHVRLQYEVKPFGTPFNGSGLVTTNAIDTGTPVLGIGSAVSLSDLASGLSSETLYQWRLRIISNSPFFPRSQWLAQSGNAATEADVRTAPTVTGVGEVLSGASESWLKPCAPNPFTTVTRLSYALPARGRVRLAIYDVSGRNVVTLADEIHEAGAYSREWDGHGSGGQRLPSGVYFARLEFGARVVAQKVVLTR